MNYFIKLPRRVKDYLVNWKDENTKTFVKRFKYKGLAQLTQDELLELFLIAQTNDIDKLFRNDKKK
jgi:hypothetical protein